MPENIPCNCECQPILAIHGLNKSSECDCQHKDCNDMESMMRLTSIYKRRSDRDLTNPSQCEDNPCKTLRMDSYYYRFIMVVLEALRDLKECHPKCDGFTVATIVEYVWENFLGDGDIESQVLTALRLAHVSGLVVYLEDENAYRLVTPEITNMCASYKRYQRFLRRRRELARPGAICTRVTKCNTSRSKECD